MSLPFEQAVRSLKPGQTVRLEPGSPIYRGPYHATVLGVNGDGMRISVPLDHGKLVLLPVGTRVGVAFKGEGGEERAIEMQISMRTGGKDRALFLSPALPERPQERVTEPVHHSVPVIAVSSGKGGVGKSTLVVNLGIALSRLGRRVCIIDGDLGTANVDVLLNLATPYNLAHVVHGEKHMLEVVVEGPEDMIILPGGSGFQDLTTLPEESFRVLLAQFQQLEEYADVLLIDTGSGLSPSVTNFILAASQAILITTPEPHAITDCYALIKVLAGYGYEAPLHLVVNRVESEREGDHIARKMAFASKRFLHMELRTLGYIMEDPAIVRSIRRQSPVLVDEPRSRASLQIMGLAERLVGEKGRALEQAGSRSFLERMRRLLPLGKVQA